jgi:hypothetical protein
MTKSRVSLLLLLAALAGLCYATFGRAVSWTYTTANVTPQIVSASGAAGTLTATLTGGTGRMTYLEGFDVTGGGATGASVINITVTGTTNTLNFSTNILGSATGPMNAQGTYSVRFPTPVPSSATNTNIVVTVPSFGSGNTLASVTAYGFTQ